MMRRAFNALCHFRSVIPSLVKGDEGGFSASIASCPTVVSNTMKSKNRAAASSTYCSAVLEPDLDLRRAA